MHPIVELLRRNLDRFGTGERISWINPPVDGTAGLLGDMQAEVRCFSQDYHDVRALRRQGIEATFGDFPEFDKGTDDHVILSLPKGKAVLEMLLHCLASRAPSKAHLWLAGENRTGIKSAAPLLSRRYTFVDKRDSARHCVLFEAAGARDNAPFDPEAYRNDFALSLPDGEMQLASWPGVFAHGRLDEGSALLLPQLPILPKGSRVLDLGTGCGVLGACLAASSPDAEVWMSDSHALALRAARATLQGNGLVATVLASDGFSEIEGNYDLVVSNPPFHRGHATENDMSIRMLEPIRNFLRPGGQLLLVANRHLPYRRWLDQAFGGHEILASNSQYHVLNVRCSGP